MNTLRRPVVGAVMALVLIALSGVTSSTMAVVDEEVGPTVNPILVPWQPIYRPTDRPIQVESPFDSG